MYFAKQTFTVIGMSASGRSATSALLKRGAKTYMYDDDERRLEAAARLFEKSGAIKAASVEDAVTQSDVIVLSPGVKLDQPYLIKARHDKKRIIGELELGFSLARCPFIGVTGTNGKTTVCSLIHHVLKESGLNSYLVGNVGTPVTEVVDELNETAVAVTEVSSFQLETIKTFCPHIAVVLNITPDHLDRHYNMDNYVYLKRRILSNLTCSEYAVLNMDDQTVAEFAKDLSANVVFFSATQKADVFADEEYYYFKGKPVAKRGDIRLIGEHNVENALAATAVLKCMGVSDEDIAKGFRSFKGVRHRIELIFEKNGVKYYNDSKSTNVDSTIKAVKSMTVPTVLILGGKDKGLDYTKLFDDLKDSLITHAVITGENRFKMLENANQAGFYKVSLSASFESAVKIAKIEVKEGGAVLLSPASASFDMFTDYEERGREFERIVKRINE